MSKKFAQSCAVWRSGLATAGAADRMELNREHRCFAGPGRFSKGD